MLFHVQVRLAQQHQAAAAALRDHRQDGRALVEAAEGEARRLTAEGDALLKRARKVRRRAVDGVCYCCVGGGCAL